MYRPSTSGVGIIVVDDPSTSIMPRYATLSGAGAVVEVPEVTVVGDPTAVERQAIFTAGVLFFIGLALGYIWGGTTGDFRHAR